MRTQHLRKYKLLCGVAMCAMLINSMAPIAAAAAAAAESGSNDNNTTTPIKHVIVIIGENRSFDHLFATYVPKKDTALNLLSEGIIKADGTPGKNYNLATQYQASDTAAIQKVYLNSPPKTGPYMTLPAPLADGGYTNGQPPFSTVAEALTYENGLPPISDDGCGSRVPPRQSGHADLLQPERCQPPAAGPVPDNQHRQPDRSYHER
jgi:phospholipase C